MPFSDVAQINSAAQGVRMPLIQAAFGEVTGPLELALCFV